MSAWIRWGLLPVILGFGLGAVARWALHIDGNDPAYAEGIGMLVTLAVSEGIRQRLEPRDEDPSAQAMASPIDELKGVQQGQVVRLRSQRK